MIATITLQAKVVNTQQALNLAKQFRQTQVTRGLNSAKTDMKLAYTAPSAEYYVFNGSSNTGYVIVAGDDCAAPILGYSDKGNFNADSIPPAMKTWLSIYAKQVAAAAESGAKYEAATATDHERIPHLLTTTWSQKAPYNDLCPIDTVQQKRTVTGCSATAMAQVVNYHKWPEQATGSADAWLVDYNTQISRNMDGDVFDWNNMLDTYATATTGTDEQRAAVALLMADMGYSIETLFGVEGSSSLDLLIPGALIKHFNYDKGAHTEAKEWYTEAQWDSLIYNELANKRPVIMGGVNEDYTVGHEFICEGYEGDGFYWFNWGWGGKYDGKFLLSALNPQNKYNFNTSVLAIVGVQKPQEGSDIVWLFGNSYPICTYVDEETQTLYISTCMTNFSAFTFTGKKALRATNTVTGEIYHFEIDADENIGVYKVVYDTPDIILDPLPDGVYKICAEYCPNGGEWTLSRTAQNTPKDVTVTVSGGKRTYSSDEVSAINGMTGDASAVVKSEVFDMRGMRVAASNGKASLNNLHPGVYIVKTTNSHGVTTTTKAVAR